MMRGCGFDAGEEWNVYPGGGNFPLCDDCAKELAPGLFRFLEAGRKTGVSWRE